MVHWSDQYVGKPCNPVTYDCAEFAKDVLHNKFNKYITIPSRADTLRGLSKQIESLKEDYAYPVGTPQEGDGVLMMGRGRLDHIGIYCEINNIPYVIHAMRNCKQVVLTRIRDLDKIGLTFQGYWRWR